MEDGLYQIIRPNRAWLTPIPGTLTGGEIGQYNEAGGSYVTSDRFRVRYQLTSETGTDYFEYGFTGFPSKYSTLEKIRITCVYYAINDYYWNTTLSEWVGTGHNHVQCTVTPFIKINGVRYFGTPAGFGADNPLGHEYDPPATNELETEKTVYYDWFWNPATVEVWDVADYQDITFGVRVQSPGALGLCIIYRMYPTFYFTGVYLLSEAIEYRMLSPVNNTTTLTQYTQTPIKADDLRFRFHGSMPLRSEIALVKEGILVFHGLLWSASEKSSNDFEFLAKSQQILLDYRLIGPDFCIDEAISISDLLSDDAPTYPGYGYLPEKVSTELETGVNLNIYYWNITTGLFNFINSWNGTFRKYSLPGGTAMLEDHEFDTFLRPGTNDFGDRKLDLIPDTNGTAAKIFSDMFLKFGQEVRYRYEWDGKVYQDAAIEIADGTENAPLYEFVHGDNATITMKIPSAPNISAAIGTGNNPKVSSSWKARRGWHSRVFSSQRIADDLQDYLDAQIDTDDTTYDIILPYEVWTLRPGDYIAIQPKDYPLTPVRVRQITTGKGKTQILAGKRLLSLNEQFGIWRDTKYAGHQYEEIKENEIASSDDLSISKDFTILSGDLVDGWQCVASIQWDFTMRNVVYIDDNGQEGIDTWATIDSNTSPFPPEAYIQITGDTYNAYGSHEYEFYITRNITAHGIEPYGENDVEVLTTGKFKWRKDGGSWSSEIEGYDVWHETSEFNAALGDGLYGRVIFSLVPPGDPWMISKTSNIQDKSASAWACETIDLSLTEKVLILKIDGEVIPPGRYLAKGDSGSMEVDITEFCDAAGTYALAAELIGGQDRSANPSYYHSLSGSITQSRRYVPMVV